LSTVEPVEPSVASASPRWRNVVFFLADYTVFAFALSFVDMTSVMPTLISHFTAHPLLIGLIGSVQTGCWLLPQLFVARLVAARARKLPVVLLFTAASRFSWTILLVGLIFADRLGPGPVLVLAYLAIGGFFFFDGLAVTPWYDLLAHAVSVHRRGRLLGTMALTGGMVAVVGGLVVQRIAGNPVLPFPSDYRLMLMIALVCFGLGVIPLALVDEPAGEATAVPEPLGAYLRRLPGLLRDQPDFRRLVEVQVLVGMAGLAIPFYAPFGTERLGLGEASVGTFTVGVTLGAMVGGVAWGWLGDHGRKEWAIRLLSTGAVLAPILALGIGVFGQSLSATALVSGLTASFFLIGCSSRSGWVAFSNYVIAIATPAERPVLIGLMNSLGGVLAVAPPLGGLLAGALGYEAAFAASILPVGAGVLLSFGLNRRAAT
jgi:MFS family permease